MQQTQRARMPRRNNMRTNNNNNRYNNNRKPTRRYGSGNMSIDNNEDLQVIPGSKSYHQAIQLRHKYNEMAKDAIRSGDRVLAENWYQHVDHFNRIVIEADELQQEKRSHITEKSEEQYSNEEDTNNYETENTYNGSDENGDYIKPLEHCLPPMLEIDMEEPKEGQ